MYKVFRHVKVSSYNAGEGIEGSLVGGIGSPIRQCFQLFFTDGVTEKRRVMSLNDQLEAVAASSDMCPHAVTDKDVL